MAEKMWFSTRPTVSMKDSPNYVETFDKGKPGDPLDNSLLDHPDFFSVVNPGAGYPGEGEVFDSPWIRSTDDSRSTVKSPAGLASGQSSILEVRFIIPTGVWVTNLKYVYRMTGKPETDGLQVFINDALLYDHIRAGDPGYAGWGRHVVDISTRITPGQETKVTFVHYKKAATTEETAITLDTVEIQHNGSIINDPGEELISFDGSTGYELMYHRVGALAPPIEYLEYRIPFEAGSFPTHMDLPPRNIELGIRVMGSDQADLYRKISTLRSKLIGTDGALYHEAPGRKRLIYCRYIEGLEGEEKSETMGAGYFMHLALVFRCFNPLFFGSPIYNAGSATYRLPIINTGDTAAWPVIQIKGPATSPIYLYCYPDGETKPTIPTMQINSSIPAGRTLTIDGRPGRKTIKLDDGTNLYPHLHDQYRSFISIPNNGQHYIELDCGSASNDREVFWLQYYQPSYWGIY